MKDNNNNTEGEFYLRDDVYEYSNNIATYHIQFEREREICYKYEILCPTTDLWQEITKVLDTWSEPWEVDNLDLKALIYDSVEFGGKIHFLSSYIVKIGLVQSVPSQEASSNIQAPYFGLNEISNKKTAINKRVKSFKDFKRL